MAPASSSRRRTAHRRNNSEDIEDARSTQVNGNDEQVSDEDQPSRQVRAKKEKVAKGKQKMAFKADEEDGGDAAMDGDDSEDDDDDIIDVDNFPDQPLRKEDNGRIAGMSRDWKTMRDMIDRRADIYKDVAAAMAEAENATLRLRRYATRLSAGNIFIRSLFKDLKKLEKGIKEFIDVGAEMTAHSEALEALQQRVARGEEISDSIEVYQKELETRNEAYAGKTLRQKYAKDERYREFRSSVWEVHHPEEPMPPITNFLPQEAGDDSDDDDDIEMGGATQNFNDPLTLTLMVDPLTSRVCKHSYSKASIKEYLQGKREAKCPAAGCNKIIRFADCLPDEALAKKIATYQRRQQAADSDSDAEEVVD